MRRLSCGKLSPRYRGRWDIKTEIKTNHHISSKTFSSNDKIWLLLFLFHVLGVKKDECTVVVSLKSIALSRTQRSKSKTVFRQKLCTESHLWGSTQQCGWYGARLGWRQHFPTSESMGTTTPEWAQKTIWCSYVAWNEKFECILVVRLIMFQFRLYFALRYVLQKFFLINPQRRNMEKHETILKDNSATLLS